MKRGRQKDNCAEPRRRCDIISAGAPSMSSDLTHPLFFKYSHIFFFPSLSINSRRDARITPVTVIVWPDLPLCSYLKFQQWQRGSHVPTHHQSPHPGGGLNGLGGFCLDASHSGGRTSSRPGARSHAERLRRAAACLSRRYIIRPPGGKCGEPLIHRRRALRVHPHVSQIPRGL